MACNRYIKVTPCAGTGPDLYICLTRLPSFNANTNVKYWFYYKLADGTLLCYNVPRDADHTCVPGGGLITRPAFYYSSSSYPDCVGCDSVEDPSPTGPGGGGGGGDGSGSGTGGGGSGTGGTDGTTPQNYWIAIACASTLPNPPTVYVNTLSSFNTTSNTPVFRWGAWCYFVRRDGAKVKNIPKGAQVVSPFGNYTFCVHCSQGIPCVPCSCQELPATYQPLYAHTQDADNFDEPIIFEYNGVCYRLNPEDEAVQIPANGVVAPLSAMFDDCGDCCGGILGTLCDETQTAPKLWVRANRISWSGVITDKFQGRCYSFDSEAPRVPRKAVYTLYVPKGQYVTTGEVTGCDKCLCSAPISSNGIMWRQCPNSKTAGGQYWTPFAWLPAAKVVQNINGKCFILDPDGDLQPIPLNASWIFPSAQYPTCADCNNAGRPITPPPPDTVDPPCGPDETRDPIRGCVPNDHDCDPGFYWNGTECVSSCGEGSHWDEELGACVPDSPPVPPEDPPPNPPLPPPPTPCDTPPCDPPPLPPTPPPCPGCGGGGTDGDTPPWPPPDPPPDDPEDPPNRTYPYLLACDGETYLPAYIPNYSGVAKVDGACYKTSRSTTKYPPLAAGTYEYFSGCLACDPVNTYCYNTWRYNCITEAVTHVAKSCQEADISTDWIYSGDNSYYKIIKGIVCNSVDVCPDGDPPSPPGDTSSCVPENHCIYTFTADYDCDGHFWTVIYSGAVCDNPEEFVFTTWLANSPTQYVYYIEGGTCDDTGDCSEPSAPSAPEFSPDCDGHHHGFGGSPFGEFGLSPLIPPAGAKLPPRATIKAPVPKIEIVKPIEIVRPKIEERKAETRKSGSKGCGCTRKKS